MMFDTTIGIPVDSTTIDNYFEYLINHFFKILPLWENREPSVKKYIRSLQFEMLGCKEFIPSLQHDPRFLSLLNILQQFIIQEDCDVPTVKREVFHAISICTQLRNKYTQEEAS